MSMIEIKVEGEKRLIWKLSNFLRRAENLDSDVEAAGAAFLVEDIRSFMGHPPGPGIVTGEYRDSWHVAHEGGHYVAKTDHPAARRLEYGFIGRDIRGRMYTDPPRPHVRPGMVKTMNRLNRYAKRLVMKAWHGT